MRAALPGILPQPRGAINKNPFRKLSAPSDYCPRHRVKVNAAHVAARRIIDASSERRSAAFATFVARAFSNSVKVV